MDLGPSKPASRFRAVENLPADEACPFIVADLADFGETVDALSSVDTGIYGKAALQAFHAIVHLAASAAVRRFTDPVTFRNNMLSTYNVFEASRRLGIKNIVWASSETALDCRSRRRTLRSARRRMCPPGKRLFSFEVVERRDG
jgi:nucleoside-diphosphate-sugar epimerase